MSSVKLERLIGPRVMFKLSNFIFNTNLNSPIAVHDKYFIDFVKESYKVEADSRPSISQLINILDRYGCLSSKNIAMEYAIRLEQMASSEGNESFTV